MGAFLLGVHIICIYIYIYTLLLLCLLLLQLKPPSEGLGGRGARTVRAAAAVGPGAIPGTPAERPWEGSGGARTVRAVAVGLWGEGPEGGGLEG